MPVPIDIPKDKWAGKVREITIGAMAADGGTRTRTVTVGGEATMPYLHFEGANPHAPAIAIEIQDKRPEEWSALLLKAWGEAAKDPAEWAKAAEAAGADLILLKLNVNDEQGKPNTAERARAIVRKVLKATGLPLMVFGPGQAEIDNDLLVAVAEEAKGEKIVLGLCEDKNYRTLVAAALSQGHLVNSRTPMDVNLAKQLVILIKDMGLPLERILLDPTTGALGYGIEYGYSVMERLRLAALQGDAMTQQPMLVTPGEEAWRQKEARAAEGVPGAWGEWADRAVNWETVTAVALIESGADIVVLRHPESVARVKAMVAGLMEGVQ
jgi:acetyl-CoA decarbonylase/synthase complex subunit delta